MTTRYAEAVWNGTLREGNGNMRTGSGALEGPFTFATRFEEDKGSNPEELLGAALAGCFSMALSGDLVRGGFTPEQIETKATVTLDRVDGKPTITRIHLDVQAKVPGIDVAVFQQTAEDTKKNCPVSRALAVPEVTLNAKLI